MSVVESAADRMRWPTVDWLTGALLGLLAIATAGALLAATYLDSVGLQPVSSGSTPTLGVGMTALLIVESLVLVVLYRYWSKLPADWRKWLKRGAVVALGATVYALQWAVGRGYSGTVIFVTGGLLIGLNYLADQYDYSWLIWNACVLLLAGLFGGIVGTVVPPLPLATFLGLIILWDVVAVRLTDWMGTLVEMSSGGIPNYLIIPNGWRVDFEAVGEFLRDDGEKPGGLEAIIGAGDLALPAALVVALTVGGELVAAIGAAAGIAVATVLLRDALEVSDVGLPALVWVNTGALSGGGLVLAAGVVGV